MQHLKSSNMNVKSKSLSHLLSISSQPPTEYQTIPASEDQPWFPEVECKKKEKKIINIQRFLFAGFL